MHQFRTGSHSSGSNVFPNSLLEGLGEAFVEGGDNRWSATLERYAL
jgi:hypothetical protein